MDIRSSICRLNRFTCRVGGREGEEREGEKGGGRKMMEGRMDRRRQRGRGGRDSFESIP